MQNVALEGSTTIKADPAAVAAALSGPQGLATWLADEARSEKRAGGRISLWWNDGRRLSGRWTLFDPPNGFEWRARLTDGGGATGSFGLSAEGDATLLHSALLVDDPDGADAWRAAWRHALDDLKAYVEDGLNGRYARRPMIGISLDEVDAAMAEAKALPVTSGILVTDVVPDGGAAKAGLRAGDVLVALEDRALSDWSSVGIALDAHGAGDTVPVTYWREGEKRIADVTLGSRSLPTADRTAEALRAALQETQARLREQLAAELGAMTDEEADHRPTEGAWNVKQVLAHLLQSEAWFASDAARVASDEPSLGWSPGADERWSRVLAALPLGDLTARLETQVADAHRMYESLLGEGASPALRYQIADWLQWAPDHMQEHLQQIRDNVAAARAPAAT